jgi:cellulose synthase operon protein C
VRREGVVMGVLISALALTLGPRAAALTWPDAAERAARDLASPDPGVRLAATEKLQTLGASVATPLLVRALGDPDVDVRIAAAHAAIARRVVAAVPLVLPWLGERETSLRRAACEVAGALPDPAVTAPLARALGDADATVRAAAATALGAQSSPDATAPLIGKLDDSNPVVRAEVVHALARLGDPRAVVPLVGKAEDSVPEVRQAVARALGALGDPRAAPALILELRDGSTDVKAAALSALGLLHADSAVDAIAPLASDRTPLLRRAAIEALGRIGSADAVRALVLLLGTGDDASAGLETSAAREALVRAGPKAIPALIAVLSGPSTPLSATSAAWTLGELHATAAAPDIVRAMRRGILPVTAALHALAANENADMLPVVLEFVDDKNAAARKEAILATAALLDPARPDGRAVEPLTAALVDVRLPASERATVAFLLGRTGAPRAASILVGLFAARDLEVRLAAIGALGALGATREGEAPLIEALDDPDASIRLHAAVALGRVGTTVARDALLARLEKDSDLDRAATLSALAGVVARVPSDAAVGLLAHALDLSQGPVRDALILALGRADLPSAMPALTALARSPNPEDRRTLAAVLAARRASPATLDLLGGLLADADPAVRADAAWSLGEVGSSAAIAALKDAARRPDLAAATNATAAIARIFARARSAALAATELCPLLSDPRSQVRANAAAGLALAGARCGDGAAERRLLDGEVAIVRASAALAVVSRPLGPADAQALERCRTSDPSGAVAQRCQRATHPGATGTEPVEIYVEDSLGIEPKPGGPFVAEFSDGLLRAGKADRRGALFDARAPAGEVTLLGAEAGTK